MKEMNKQLETVFMFQSSDLRFNRKGQLSQHQQSRLRAGRSNMFLSLIVFVFVMLGTFGFIIFMQRQGEKDYRRNIAPKVSQEVAKRVLRDERTALLIPVSVIGVVIIGGVVWFIIQRAHSEKRRISVAKGKAEVVSNDQIHYNVKVKIGETVLRLTTLEQLEAFIPAVEYRVFYLSGPRPTILSAEVVGSETIPEEPLPDGEGDDVKHAQFMQLQKRGRMIVLVLGVLALGIPFVGVAASELPKGLRILTWIALVVIATGFVSFAIGWLSPRKPKDRRQPP